MDLDNKKASFAMQSMGDNESVNQSVDQFSNGFAIFQLSWAQFSTSLSASTGMLFFAFLVPDAVIGWAGDNGPQDPVTSSSWTWSSVKLRLNKAWVRAQWIINLEIQVPILVAGSVLMQS